MLEILSCNNLYFDNLQQIYTLINSIPKLVGNITLQIKVFNITTSIGCVKSDQLLTIKRFSIFDAPYRILLKATYHNQLNYTIIRLVLTPKKENKGVDIRLKICYRKLDKEELSVNL